MIFKEIEWKDDKTKFNYEEVPQEDLWEDGEISTNTCMIKIYNGVIDGDYILVRRINK
jgi:hypothetical protein